MKQAILRFPIGIDAVHWQQRHIAGEVPSRLPYGLEHLVESGIQPVIQPVSVRNSYPARLIGKATGSPLLDVGPTPPTSAGDSLVCWSEQVGIAELLRGRPALPLTTGVVWLTDEMARRRTRLIAARALPRAHRVFAHSSAQLPILVKEFGLDQRRVAYLPFGIDCEFFTPDEGGIEVMPSLIASAGVDRHRDFPTLLSAIALVQQKIPAARLQLATRLAVPVPAELGQQQELPHAELRNLYHRSAVVAIACKPNVHVSGITAILESMACGKVVVATDTAGMREYIVHNENGILVPPADPYALSAAITELLHDPAKANELGAAGRRAAESKFSTREKSRRLAEIIS